MLYSKAKLPSINCAKTVEKRDFTPQAHSNTEVPIQENWLYCTKSKKTNGVKADEAFKVSDHSPEWFKTSRDFKNPSKEETITVFSRLSGWIYVPAESKNRKHRLGKTGPISGEPNNNIQTVSNLAPVWMQRESKSLEKKINFKNFQPPNIIRQEPKRMILVDDQTPEKSIFSFGDFRHNIRTKDEVDIYNKTASDQPKKFLDWKEDISKQRYDKDITGKIGTRNK